MSTTTDLTTLKINYLTQAQYDAAVSGGTINANELYMTPGPTIPTASSSIPEDVSVNTAGAGSATTYSRSDHIHGITGTTIESALGYTPYSSFGSLETVGRSSLSGGWTPTSDGFLIISGVAASGQTPYVYVYGTFSGTQLNVFAANLASGGRVGSTIAVKSGITYTMLYDSSSSHWDNSTLPSCRFMPIN